MRLRTLLNWWTVLLFAVAGPIVGTLLVFLPDGYPGQGGWAVLQFIAGTLPMGYLLGFPPALTTGLVVGAVQPRLSCRRPLAVAILMAVGAIFGFLSVGLYHLALGDGFADLFRQTVGAMSGAICSLLASFTGVGPNNSFKPKPLRGSA
jgi:hypothetical protein